MIQKSAGTKSADSQHSLPAKGSAVIQALCRVAQGFIWVEPMFQIPLGLASPPSSRYVLQWACIWLLQSSDARTCPCIFFCYFKNVTKPMCADMFCRSYVYTPSFINILVHWASHLKNHQSQITCQPEHRVPTLSLQFQQIIKLCLM